MSEPIWMKGMPCARPTMLTPMFWLRTRSAMLMPLGSLKTFWSNSVSLSCFST